MTFRTLYELRISTISSNAYDSIGKLKNKSKNILRSTFVVTISYKFRIFNNEFTSHFVFILISIVVCVCVCITQCAFNINQYKEMTQKYNLFHV